MCVFFYLWMLCIILLRDIFESLKCWLDHWLSSLLVCIHFFVFFLSLKNCFLSSSIASRQLSIYRAPWIFYLDRSYRIFDPSKLSGICLDSFSTDSRSIEKDFVWPIDSQQNPDPSRWFCHWQILNSTSIDSYLLRFSARQILNPSRCIFYIYA